MPDASPRPARVRAAPVRHRDRRRLGSRDARSRARAPRRGWDVEVLTTCARDHYTWRNEYAPGTTTDNDGVVVHRFPVEGSKPSRSRARIEARIQSGAPVPLADQLAWLDGLFRVPGLFHHLVVNADRYDAVILSPYLFWTTVTGATIVPGAHDRDAVPARRAVRLPRRAEAGALRRRAPVVPLRARAPARARLRVVARSRRDRRRCARPRRATTPTAFAPATASTRPFLLFAGRRERGKGWDWLLAAFHFAIRQYGLPFDLVTIGVSPADAPADLSGRVHDLGFLDEAEVADAFAAATAYVQPSTNESFSRTIMESWLAGHAGARDRRKRSVAMALRSIRRRALTFADEFELAQCLSFLAAAPDEARASPRPDASTCWRTIDGTSCSTRWKPACGSCCARPRSRLVPAARARRVPPNRRDRCTGSARRATTSTCSRAAARPRSSAARSPGPLGALLTWWRGRRYDAVVVQVESGAPLRVSHGRRPRRPPRRLPRVGTRAPGGARRHAGRARHRRRSPIGRRPDRPLPLDRGRPPARHERARAAPPGRRGRRARSASSSPPRRRASSGPPTTTAGTA